MKLQFYKSAALLGALCLPLCLLAQQPAKDTDHVVSKEDAHEIIGKISKQLEEGYPFPEISKKYIATMKSQEAKKAYQDLTPAKLAWKITDDLRGTHKDVHLTIFHNKDYYEQLTRSFSNTRTPEDDRLELERKRQNNYGFDAVELNKKTSTAYIKISGGFHGDQEAFEMAANAMNMAAYSKNIIIDIRDNGGGTGMMGRFLAGYFFNAGDERYYLHGYHKDRTKDIQEWTYPFVPGKRMPDSKLYILVNKRTASATEGFAFALQQMHRATIVGDTTAGAGIAGSMIPLKENMVVFMPVKMVAAPGSEEGWEGKGVIPDVAVKGEDARTEAEKLIKKEQDDIAAAKTK
ncbi:S41 family peptidase [Chitinophaga pinensis]|uniref:Peptidase S41 n=1 Tax=Chitinophaga pinensis (strain ATCC 43595 / DSM 2588 / LMG 13176 / NBRC 15968 / NCIMB 11800 / UQM 2034) TaxID=485918 RepID=A0A979GBC1_CHIPD|nr:S41 family peptidase [Chitinophaga pinensis]ACU64182.1 peptidase S41 [Chitinophaga pinensis DSM 2588]